MSSVKDLIELAHRTDGYCGADIAIVTREKLTSDRLPYMVCLCYYFTNTRWQANQPIDGEWRNDLLFPCSPSEWHVINCHHAVSLPYSRFLRKKILMKFTNCHLWKFTLEMFTESTSSPRALDDLWNSPLNNMLYNMSLFVSSCMSLFVSSSVSVVSLFASSFMSCVSICYVSLLICVISYVTICVILHHRCRRGLEMTWLLKRWWSQQLPW